MCIRDRAHSSHHSRRVAERADGAAAVSYTHLDVYKRQGYLGVESAYRLLTGKEPAAKRVDTATTLVTRENMYRPEYQKILFRYE